MAGRLQESYVIIINFLSDYFKKENYPDVFALFSDELISNISTSIALMKLHVDEIQYRANSIQNLNRDELIDGLKDDKNIVESVTDSLIQIKQNLGLQGNSLTYINNFLYSFGHYVINWNFQVMFNKDILNKANILAKTLKGTIQDSKEMFSVLLTEESNSVSKPTE
jgi:hypothetical protein